MEKNNKRKAELVESVEARVLLVAGAENPDGSLHDLSKVLEDHSYEVFKCNGVDGILPQVKKNRIDIILTEGNLLSQHLRQILREMNITLILISSNDIVIDCKWWKGNIVRPILELVENLFGDRLINKSGEVKRLKEEIKQVELPDEEKLLKEEVEHDELPDEEKLPEEKRLKEEVEHAELPDEENKKKLGREKAGEHHQRMVWTGDRERIFAKIVTELDKNGKATGKKVWERMQAYGFKDISIKQVNSHLQKHRGKLKKVHPVDKDQVDTSPGHGASRHGMEEHSSKTDAPMNTINGNLNTTSQKQHSITELLNNNIPGNFGNPNILYNGETFENGKGKDMIQDRNCMDDDFIGTPLTRVPQSSPEPVEATPLTIKSYNMGGCQSTLTPLIIESSTMGGCQSNSSMTMEGNFGNPNILYNGETFENGKGKDMIQDRNCMDDDFIGTPLTQVPQSSPEPVEVTPFTIKSYNIGGCQSTSAPLIIESSTMYGCQSNSSMTMEGQPSNLFVKDIPGQAFDKNVSGLQSEEYEKVHTPLGSYFGDFDPEVGLQQHLNMDNDDHFEMNDNLWGN